MAKNKANQGKQKGKDKFFMSPSKHSKTWNKESKQNRGKQTGDDNFFMSASKHGNTWNKESKKEPNTSAPDNFFVKATDKVEPVDIILEDRNFERKRKKRQAENSESETILNESKKPFDKKKYRLQKYSKKYKIQQWEERRKKVVIQKYQREMKKNPFKSNAEEIYSAFENLTEEAEDQTKEEIADSETIKNTQFESNQKKRFRKPHEEFKRIKEEKQRKQQDFLKRKVAREEARNKALKKRADKSKKLSRKTKKGQPIMKYRMEMLLEKIQQSMQQ